MTSDAHPSSDWETCHVMTKPSGESFAALIDAWTGWAATTWNHVLVRTGPIVLTGSELLSIYPVAAHHPEWFAEHRRAVTSHHFLFGPEINRRMRHMRGERTEPWEPAGHGVRGFLRRLMDETGRTPGRFDDFLHVSETSADAVRTLRALQHRLPRDTPPIEAVARMASTRS